MVIFLLCLPAVLLSQGVSRSEPGQQPTGTAVIRGRVIVADLGDAVPRVEVAAMLLARPQREGPAVYRTDTDDAGAFELRGLPAGRYSVFAIVPRDRPQFVSNWFGSDDDHGRVAVNLADGEILEKVVVPVQRTAVITGRVINEFGEPIAWARVNAYARRSDASEPSAVNQGRETDDLGRFRLFGLPPGEYVVKVEPGMLLSGPAGEKPLAALETYYPGVLTIEEAQVVLVAAGQEAGGIEIPLRRGRTYRVSGTVINARGVPAPRAEVLQIRGGTGQSESAGSDGTFTFVALPEGDYTFQATTMMMFQSDEADPEQSPPLKLRVESDIEGLTLTMRRAARVTGRVVVDGQPPLRVEGLQVTGMPADLARAFGMLPMTNVREDGSFTLSRVFGPTVVRFQPLMEPWHLQSVRYKGNDITDVLTEFDAAGQSSDDGISQSGVRAPDLEVVISNRASRITGRVTDASGAAARSAAVVAFAADERKWFANATTTRITGVDLDGVFELAGLRPDSYMLIAVPSLEGATRNGAPDFAKFAPLATPVTLGTQETREVSLTLTP